ncbi:hypothetical protein [Sphingosinicella rhizophila]|uniref:Uncharacterized protein n=1 Tax=Sphingosinicella rhizophila TaxID=3050082 RepID=A0ABU3QAR0_9SPHN|nr:hypothetical protein [Sphingosinicella sp. GR2756]MDT9600088.1 hypothetical protein [Sphingosinicella sp. GR2756]
MFRVAQSAWDFSKGLSGAIGLAIAAVSDPLRWFQALGFMTNIRWSIEPWMRQSIFAGLAFLWLFVWYHKTRTKFEDQQPKLPNMPIHKAARWVAQHSAWAASLPANADDRWVDLVGEEMVFRLGLGRLNSWSYQKYREQIPSKGPYDMNFREWALGDFNWYKLVLSEPPHSFCHANVLHRRVMLNEEEVKREWPRRSLWQRLTGKSPIDRLNARARLNGVGGYDEVWREQDEAYNAYLLRPAYSGFEECFEVPDGERDNLQTI